MTESETNFSDTESTAFDWLISWLYSSFALFYSSWGVYRVLLVNFHVNSDHLVNSNETKYSIKHLIGHDFKII